MPKEPLATAGAWFTDRSSYRRSCKSQRVSYSQDTRAAACLATAEPRPVTSLPRPICGQLTQRGLSGPGSSLRPTKLSILEWKAGLTFPSPRPVGPAQPQPAGLCATFSSFQEVPLLPPSPPLSLPRVLGSQFLSWFDCNSLTSPFGQKPRLAPSRPSGSQPHSHRCGKRLEPGLSRPRGTGRQGPQKGSCPRAMGRWDGSA